MIEILRTSITWIDSKFKTYNNQFRVILFFTFQYSEKNNKFESLYKTIRKIEVIYPKDTLAIVY